MCFPERGGHAFGYTLETSRLQCSCSALASTKGTSVLLKQSACGNSCIWNVTSNNFHIKVAQLIKCTGETCNICCNEYCIYLPIFRPIVKKKKLLCTQIAREKNQTSQMKQIIKVSGHDIVTGANTFPRNRMNS